MTTPEEIAKAQEWCAEQWERDNPNSFIGYGTLAAYAAHVTAEKVKPLVAALRKAKAFHDRDEGCNGFTAEYETLRLMIDQALKQFGEG